ncbi:unnamed protein product [Penicillium olsonii]|nr:unnamed protein product [Penicillium olsonii]
MRPSTVRHHARLGLPASRLFHSSTAVRNDVFANSLRKTLDAHRSTNRARLIRKIYPKEDPPGLWRPEIPPQSRVGYQTPVDPALPAAESPDTPEPELGAKKRRKKAKQKPPGLEARRHEEAIQPVGKGPAQTPWLKNVDLPRASAEITLDTEIRALVQYLTPSAEERCQFEKVRTEVASLLKGVVPQAPQVIGSHRTGLVLAHSDLDFILPFEDLQRSPERDRRPSATRPQIQDSHIRLLRQVERTLQQTAAFRDQIYPSDKRNPALSARHRPTGLWLHFYCGEGIPAITEYLQDYQAEYPSLKPLYAVTRILLEARGLFGAPQASISPDALAMLIVAFLKVNHGRFTAPNSLGDQFLALLRLYGNDVNLQTVGVAVDPPSFFGADTLVPSGDQNAAYQRGQRSLVNAKRTAAAKGNTPVANRLCIQDPTHYMNDLGRSCTRTSELRGAFAAAYEHLRRACDDWAGEPKKSSSILTSVLQARFDALENLRARILCI